MILIPPSKDEAWSLGDQKLCVRRRGRGIKYQSNLISNNILSVKPSMASNLNPAFGYTVLYVKDVAKSVAFYAKAFGYSVRRLDESHRWGELESGHTTIAFTPLHQHETDDLTGTVHTARSSKERPPVEVCFVYPDVDAAYKWAVENGAVPVSEPELKEWGQKVGYVRDMDGIVVRMGSHVKPAKLD